jgi:hypothetical protein
MAVGREPPFREDISQKGRKQPLLEAVTRQLLVKTLQAGKGSACALVICEVYVNYRWRYN